MKEFIDKLIERLEEAKVSANRRNAFDSEVSYACAIDIVNKLAEEYKGGWISTKEPPKVFMLSDGNYIPFLVFDDVIWHPYIAFYDGKKWFRTTHYNIEPIFWQKLPSRPYTEGE